MVRHTAILPATSNLVQARELRSNTDALGTSIHIDMHVSTADPLFLTTAPAF